MRYPCFDSSYFCWRAFHTTGKLTFDGQGTGVIHGFLTQVLILSRQFGLNQPLFFWDSRKSFRRELYPGYKNRPAASKKEEKERMEIYKQIDMLQSDILPVIGFKNNFRQTGLEADDLIAKFVRDNPGKAIVLTNDDDLMQLADDCLFYSPQRKERINEMVFREMYGIAPREWRKVKQLAGCSSDTVPGVRGVGNPTAIKYLTGKMNPGEILSRIESPKGKFIVKRNKPLVNLPFTGTEAIQVEDDAFSTDGFLAVCELYGLQKLADEVGDWENHFRRI